MYKILNKTNIIITILKNNYFRQKRIFIKCVLVTYTYVLITYNYLAFLQFQVLCIVIKTRSD